MFDSRTVSSVVIAGYYGRRNAGDEAILAGMLADLRAERSDLAFTVVSGDPEATRRLHGVEAVPWSDLEGLIEAVRQASLVIVGGGGLFHDYWGVDPSSLLTSRQAGIAEYGAPLVLARLLGKASALYGVGVGPLLTAQGRELTRELVGLADGVTVRDEASRQVLASIGCDPARVAVTADPAFGVPETPLGEGLRAFLATLPRPILGVSLRHWSIGVSQADWESAVAAALDCHLAEVGGTAFFVPLQEGQLEVEDDVRVCRSVMAQMGRAGEACLAPSDVDPLQRFQLLEHCDLVLGMRLHALVAAVRGGVPCVGLAYDPKVLGLMEQAERKDACLPLSLLRADALIQQLRDAWETRAACGEPLAAAGVRMREAARRNAPIALKAMSRPRQPFEGEGLTSRLLLARILEPDELEREIGRSQALAEQRETLVTERNQLEAELWRLQSTLGVRLLQVYWDTLRRLFPEGTIPRRFYRLGTGLVGRALGLSARAPAAGVRPGTWISVPETGRRNVEDGPKEAASADPRIELLRMEERCARDGDQRLATIFSTTQLILSEGQRQSNFALEFARRGTPVVFAFWTWDESALTAQERLNQGILQIPIHVVREHPEELFSALRGLERVAIFEFPYPGLFEAMALANSEGWITVYDVIDDWEAFKEVGQAPWYDREFERHLLRAADLVVTVNAHLAQKARALGRLEGDIVPNGVRPGIERIDQPRPLFRGGLTIGYFGHLSEAWVDWDLLGRSARLEPSWRFYLIGYGLANPRVRLPENVILLGRQPQSSLAAYAANWDVAIVPFKPGPLADGADAIKVYEYLAMGLPVVTTGVAPPAGAEALVLRAQGAEDFVAKIRLAAGTSAGDVMQRKQFARECTWEARVDHLMRLIAGGHQRVGEKRALFGPGDR
jgi:polysaccharide pyruvyl transferase CsaB